MTSELFPTVQESGLLASLGYLRPCFLACAVLKVFRENQAAETTSSRKASADAWAWNSRWRRELYERVLQHWCKLAGCDETWFPFSEDGIARVYFRFRKRSAAEVDAWEADLQRAVQ